MAIPSVMANFTTSLAAKISSSASSLTINRSTDDDGTTLAAQYLVTVDEGTSKEEHMIVTFAGATGTINTRGVSRVDATTNQADNQKEHDRGASVKITDMALVRVVRRLNGTEAFDSVNLTGVNSVSGLATPTSGELTKAANVQFVVNTAIAGAVDASEVAKGIVELATSAETLAGTDTGSTSAYLLARPSYIARNQQNGSFVYAASTTGNDTYVITLTPAITAYANGQVFTFKPDTANTGAATLNVNAVGAKTIKKFHDQDLETGDIEANQIVVVAYNSTADVFELLIPSARRPIGQDSSEVFGSDAGASDTYAVTLSPAPLAYVNGQVFNCFINTANTGAATLNVNSLGAKTIKKNFNQDLETGDLVAGQVIQVVYDSVTGTFQLMSPIVALPKVKAGTFSLSASGSLAITGVGFKPKAVQFFHTNSASTGGDQSQNVMMGSANSASSRAVVESYVSDAAGLSASSSSTSAVIIIRAGSSASTITEQADFTSFDTDGFTISVSTFTSARTILYVAIG